MTGKSEGLERAVEAISVADLIVVATGAGMSKESGIPTFRDAQEGLWAKYDPQQLATRQGFREDPARVWGWYNYRRGLIARTEPHAGHGSVARLETLVRELVVVTQNIDGFHQQAGSTDVLELHGNINRFKCLDHDHPIELDVPIADCDGPLSPPGCPFCGSPVRPDVVWYGEMLPPGVLERAERLARSCDVMLVVGTSGMVQPAAGLPLVARSSGATVVEVNTDPSHLTTQVDVFLQGRAGIVLPQIVAGVERRKASA
ncbi:MAG: NAD-dependent deacylase [Gemmatimonadota bacterium]|nr:MAG: NAD-dependent deacylase [Gemmatimonadota bacterium]